MNPPKIVIPKTSGIPPACAASGGEDTGAQESRAHWTNTQRRKNRGYRHRDHGGAEEPDHLGVGDLRLPPDEQGKHQIHRYQADLLDAGEQGDAKRRRLVDSVKDVRWLSHGQGCAGLPNCRDGFLPGSGNREEVQETSYVEQLAYFRGEPTKDEPASR